MLWGLEVPRDLESIFCTPATSSIAFTAPPAITPVPSDAGLRRTSPAPALPTTGWCILPVLVRGILIRFFRALSNPRSEERRVGKSVELRGGRMSRKEQ